MKISQEKRNKISEQIMLYLYTSFPNQPFTAEVAEEIARDEEFVKRILFDLKERGLVVSIRKNKNGEAFSRRIKWTLTEKVYEIYKSKTS
ncbi:MAG: hypothetical protein ACP5OG_01995 [Candidatus Nanoarchaeia archaeon]